MGVLLIAGCAKQENDGWKPGTIQFEITAEAGTRAILSEEAPYANVPNVDVHVFDDGGSFVKTIALNSIVFGNVYTLENSDILAAGTYRFLAVGQVAGSLFTIDEPEVGVTTFDKMSAALTSGEEASDIYSGSTTKAVTDQGGRIAINITRLVSGVMGYFTNIPTKIGGQNVGYLRLTMSTVNTTLDLSNGEGSIPSVNIPYDVIEFDLTDDTSTDGVYDGNGDELSAGDSGVVTLDFSYLDGKFVVPSDAVFSLALYGTDGITILKDWTINGGEPVEMAPGTLYSLGTKKVADDTDGGTPGDTADDDRGIDLMTTQELIITINPDWGTTNYLTID